MTHDTTERPLCWYIPSHNGDIRFEVIDDRTCRLVTADLTALEHEVVQRWAKLADNKGWLGAAPRKVLVDLKPGASVTVSIDVPFCDAAGTMASLLKFNARGTLTAFRFSDGTIVATDEVDRDALPRWARKILATSTPAKTAEGEKTATEPARPKPVAATTVTRPSMSCPECEGRPEKDRMACDVLWDFLDEDQRIEWLDDRAVTVVGNRTGHAYRVHARDTEAARILGRCAFDVDDGVILHNYNRMVPPEEEVLGLVLMIQLCEEWVRVEGEVDPSCRAEEGTIFTNDLGGVDYVHMGIPRLLNMGLTGSVDVLAVDAMERRLTYEMAINDPLADDYDPHVLVKKVPPAFPDGAGGFYEGGYETIIHTDPLAGSLP